ncbi:hypothetical protein ACIP5N_04655 [Streptomyces sp. NPDC088768]|uniref:hypothetical protein n=1 Tax=Streptomyces sp. NPDC088768 TaxID=3365894 RepID=UPI00381E33D7
MLGVCVFVFVFSVLVLVYIGVPFVQQRPLRERGKHTLAWEVRRVRSWRKFRVEWAFDLRDGAGTVTVWSSSRTSEPSENKPVVYDADDPQRWCFTEDMPRNPARVRNWLRGFWVVAVVTLVGSVVLLVS